MWALFQGCGSGYIHRSLPQAQSVLSIDLSAAQEVYREYTAHIGDVAHLLAQQRVVRENMQAGDVGNLVAPLQAVRQSEDLDLLILADLHGGGMFPARIQGRQIEPSGLSALIAQAIQQRKGIAATILLSAPELAMVSPEMAERARIAVVATPHSLPAGRSSLSDGLLVAAATPVLSEEGELVGVLCAGQLLNRRNSVADRIRSNLYRDERFDGRDVAVVSIFLGDIRIATSATTAAGERAVGTLVFGGRVRARDAEGRALAQARLHDGRLVPDRVRADSRPARQGHWRAGARVARAKIRGLAAPSHDFASGPDDYRGDPGDYRQLRAFGFHHEAGELADCGHAEDRRRSFPSADPFRRRAAGD